MSPVEIRNLKNHADADVELRGWLYGKRSGGKIVFLLVRDGTGICQCVVDASLPEIFAAAGSLGQESSLIVRGKVRIDERAQGGAELIISGLDVIQNAENFPISRKAHGVDFLMNHRHLWFRTPRQTAILRIRHTIINSARGYFNDDGFTLIDTPIICAGAAEGAGTLFELEYFGEKANLAQTGQLYLESAAMALGKVYCFGPTFRAEKSKTRRHLTEFWMIEPEIAFADLDALLCHEEGLVTRIIGDVLAKHRDDLAVLERDISALEKIKAPFHRMTYTEAIDLVKSDKIQTWMADRITDDQKKLQTMIDELPQLEAKFTAAKKQWEKEKLEQQIKDQRENIHDLEIEIAHRKVHLEGTRSFEWGGDLGADEEAVISRQFDRPVFVTNYPKKAKAFYMKTDPAHPDTVLNVDMLAPEGYGEVIGGSVREDDLDALEERIAEEGMNPEPFQWYLDLRRYGTVPHGGFGLGIERTVAWICGLKHIRETIPFPRTMGRMWP